MDYLKNKNTQLYKQSRELINQRSGIHIEKRMEQHQMGQCFRQKVERLPDNYRFPLILFDVEGFSHREIFRTMSLSLYLFIHLYRRWQGHCPLWMIKP